MNLTTNELKVLNYIKSVVDEDSPTIAFSEIASALNINSKVLRGIVSNLLQKKQITIDYENDAEVSFIGIRD